jgi:hypothetical protein
VNDSKILFSSDGKTVIIIKNKKLIEIMDIRDFKTLVNISFEIVINYADFESNLERLYLINRIDNTDFLKVFNIQGEELVKF